LYVVISLLQGGLDRKIVEKDWMRWCFAKVIWLSMVKWV